MFLGADVIHPTNVTRQHPFIAAMVGSGNSSCSTTAVRMAQELLEYYYEMNKYFSNEVVFYRDGVDDGQFSKVCHYEIPAIYQAFDQIYGTESNHPSLAFVIVQKHHNTRFFTYHPNRKLHKTISKKSPEDTDNISIEVNNPPPYHVLEDQTGLTPNELQLLIYHVCFTDPRSSSSEVVPSVVHQTDLAALNARDSFCTDEESSTMHVSNRNPVLQNPTADALHYEILQVHHNLKNKPVLG
ncbi:unnamed protein product [Adineta ricciae]|uniref:Piwi domain-containing protein n=1 Tax=Adineta ricciae TaxID=249248 RepID=A0A814PBF0_ADIRI|nr:unnamed protein product [Adineta ricciae]